MKYENNLEVNGCIFAKVFIKKKVFNALHAYISQDTGAQKLRDLYHLDLKIVYFHVL